LWPSWFVAVSVIVCGRHGLWPSVSLFVAVMVCGRQCRAATVVSRLLPGSVLVGVSAAECSVLVVVLVTTCRSVLVGVASVTLCSSSDGARGFCLRASFI